MSKDEYFDLLEEQHEKDVILHLSQVDAVPDPKEQTDCNKDYCDIDFDEEAEPETVCGEDGCMIV